MFDELWKFFVAAGFGVVGWFARVLWTATQELKTDLSTLKEILPVTYIRRDDFKEFKGEIMNSLHRIENKIDEKMDK